MRSPESLYQYYNDLVRPTFVYRQIKLGLDSLNFTLLNYGRDDVLGDLLYK